MASHVYLRADWSAPASPPGYLIDGAVSEVYIHHFNSGIKPVRSAGEGFARMSGADSYHRSLGWGGIGYSWCVDDLGNIYEGRGWWRTGAHTYGYNSKGYGICWLGDSNTSLPTLDALGAIVDCIRLGVKAGALTSNPTIVAHRDRVPDTSCCGDPMYAQLDAVRRLFATGATPTPAPDPSEDDMPDYLLQLRDQTICAVYPNGQARPLGGGEYQHLVRKGLVTVQTVDLDEDDRLRQYAFMG